MSLDISSIKGELASLREKKASIERKIEGLEHYLGQSATGKVVNSGISARGGVDIRPTVRAIFAENNNQPIKVKDLVDMVAQKHQDIDRQIVGKKMLHVKRTILKQVDYGRYHLRETEKKTEG